MIVAGGYWAHDEGHFPDSIIRSPRPTAYFIKRELDTHLAGAFDASALFATSKYTDQLELVLGRDAV